MIKKALLIISILLLFSGCSSDGDMEIIDPIPVNDTTILKDNDGAQIVLDEVHYRNHEGDKFHFHTNATMSTGQVAYILGCTNNRTIHFTAFEILASANPILIEFQESPIITSNGTLGNTHNTNRGSSKNATMDIYLNPIISNDGTTLIRRAILGAQTKLTGITQSGAEWILAPNTCYTFKITNNDGNNVQIYGNFFWYEED